MTDTRSLSHRPVTGELIGRVRNFSAANLPADVLDVARQTVLDWFGVAIAGAGEPLVAILREEVRAQGGAPLCSVLRHRERTSPAFATLINGSAADVLDYSDGNNAMRGHTAPAVVAASLAAAELTSASGADFLAAVVAGVEMACGVGLVGNSYPVFHPTGTLAPFGAAAASAHLLKLTQGQWAHALGVAATQAAGLLASGGTMCKPMHSGSAAMNGLLSASLAQRDFIGRADAIECEQGFYATHAREGVSEQRLDALKGRFLMLETRFKVHATCGLTHSTVENMLLLRNQHRIAAQAVRAIEVRVPPGHLGVCNILEPRTGLEAKFSLRASAAMTLLGDDMGSIASFTDERSTSAEVVGLRDRIRVTPVPGMDFNTAVAVVDLDDGRRLTLESEIRPMTDYAAQRAQVTKKFLSLVTPILGERGAGDLLRQILEIDRAPSVRSLFEIAGR